MSDHQQPAIPRPDQDAAAAARLAEFEKRTGKKPNIVILMIDDMGYGDPGAFGGGEAIGAATPNMDRLAAEGLKLTSTYAQQTCTPIDNSSATRLCAAMNHAVNNGHDEIYIVFSSLGGYTADGVFIYNHIRAMPIPVTLHATGNIASIALAIFVGAETRLCSRHCMFMTHPTTVPGNTEGMVWERLRASMDAAIAEDNRTENILRERCRLDDSTIQGRRFRDVHFTPEDAVKFGVAHRVEEFSLPKGRNIIQI